MINDKINNNLILELRKSDFWTESQGLVYGYVHFNTLIKLARLKLTLRASSGISVWRMVMWGMMDNTNDCSVWWKLSGNRWARGICGNIGTNLT